MNGSGEHDKPEKPPGIVGESLFEGAKRLAGEAKVLLKADESAGNFHISDGIQIDDLEDWECLEMLAGFFVAAAKARARKGVEAKEDTKKEAVKDGSAPIALQPIYAPVPLDPQVLRAIFSTEPDVVSLRRAVLSSSDDKAACIREIAETLKKPVQ